MTHIIDALTDRPLCDEEPCDPALPPPARMERSRPARGPYEYFPDAWVPERPYALVRSPDVKITSADDVTALMAEEMVMA